MTDPIKPDLQDFEYAERNFGRLPVNASDEEVAEHYRLAREAKLLRIALANLERKGLVRRNGEFRNGQPVYVSADETR